MSTRQRLVGGVLIASLLLQAGCGTLMHPERRGQLSGRIDPTVAILDGIGCLFFVVPGLIAFAIDFGSGAIYLPGGGHASVTPERLQQAKDDSGRLDLVLLRTIIRLDTGHDLPLDHPELQHRNADALQLARLNSLRAAG